MLFDTSVREIKNEVSSRHIFSTRFRCCHMSRSLLVSSLVCQDTTNPTWGDIFEYCFKVQSSKLERLFSLKRVKRDVRALSFELSKMTPYVGLAVQSTCDFHLVVGSTKYSHSNAHMYTHTHIYTIYTSICDLHQKHPQEHHISTLKHTHSHTHIHTHIHIQYPHHQLVMFT